VRQRIGEYSAWLTKRSQELIPEMSGNSRNDASVPRMQQTAGYPKSLHFCSRIRVFSMGLIQIKTTFSTLVRGRAVVGLIDKLLPTGWRIACVATGDHCEGVWASVKACGDNACS